MNKKKLIELINDLQADNDFNNDLDSKNNINLSIEKLKEELKISDSDIMDFIFER